MEKKIIITIILVNIEIQIIQTIIFDFENTWCIYSAFLSKKSTLKRTYRITQKELHKMLKCSLTLENNAQICIQLFCNFYESLDE